MVTARTATLPRTGSIMTTLSYIVATLGKSIARGDGRGGDGERFGGAAVGFGAAVVEQPVIAEREDGRIELARVIDEVGGAIEHGIVGVGDERGAVAGDGEADRPVGR